MTELTGWRRQIGHQGTFLASLDLWKPKRTGKMRHLQSGYRAWWSLADANQEFAVQVGPIDLVDARSLAPGSNGIVLIHPMLPEAWKAIDAGATLDLLAQSQHPDVIGRATVLERRDVPASAPLNLDPFDETPARARLHAVADSTGVGLSPTTPPTLTVSTVRLPLLSSHWSDAKGRRETAPGSRTEEIELAARLPSLNIERREPVLITVTDAELPVSAEIAYFSEVDSDGIPAGERRDVRWDSNTMLRQVEYPNAGRWSVRIPAPEGARAAVVMFTFAPDYPGAPSNHAAWGFCIR
ncbi:hypothetical protein [Georgenia daeguensis]|uniref:Uncharacterized protein n=1 Tax=Georgenia daeguensis TaxID=908355 RepID=A0ABP6UQC0_9MICO